MIPETPAGCYFARVGSAVEHTPDAERKWPGAVTPRACVQQELTLLDGDHLNQEGPAKQGNHGRLPMKPEPALTPIKRFNTHDDRSNALSEI